MSHDITDLAALAAENVPGFVRPPSYCPECDNQGGKCNCDRGYGIKWDNSPAALLMAVVMAARWACFYREVAETSGATRDAAVLIRGERSPESIARAALVALLRAHGMEVTP